MYQKWIGIDIGKSEFFVSIYQEKEVRAYSNHQDGFSAFHEQYKSSLEMGLVVLETTGGYEMALIRFLQSFGYAVHRANTRKVKHFIRSYGCLGKSDTIDAVGLARYAYERQTSLGLFVKREQENLLYLVNRLGDLKQMRTKEKNRLQAPELCGLDSSYERIIAALDTEIQALKEEIHALYAGDESFQEKKEILKTISGVGEITAIGLLALMPELGKLDRKKIASLGGLAPHPNESGKTIGHRCVRGGRRSLKPILFMAAMSASRSKSKMGSRYQKFLGSGKEKMVALVAIMRKILVIANARIRDYYAGKRFEEITGQTT